MAQKQSIFTDRVVGVSIHNGLVRLDLAVFAGTGKDKDGKPGTRMDITHQLVMPLDAFVNATQSQQKLLQQLAQRQAKAAKTSQPEGEGAAAAAPTAQA